MLVYLDNCNIAIAASYGAERGQIYLYASNRWCQIDWIAHFHRGGRTLECGVARRPQLLQVPGRLGFGAFEIVSCGGATEQLCVIEDGIRCASGRESLPLVGAVPEIVRPPDPLYGRSAVGEI